MNSRQLAREWPYPRRSKFLSDMRKAASKWFEAKGQRTHPKYKYLISNWNEWHGNIILEEVTKYVDDIQEQRRNGGNGFALHDYVHHGLSSQAFLFNLIVPLITRNDLAPLREVLESSGISWPSRDIKVSLEHEDRNVFNEDSGQPTSIDLVIGEVDEPGSLFIECKFTENGFGGCSVFGQGDCNGSNPVSDFPQCYLHFIGRRYWEQLNTFGFVKGSLATDSTCILMNHYQFFREVLFALAKKGTFILLYDSRNPTFSEKDRGLMPLLLQYVPDEYRGKVVQVSIQDLVVSIEKSNRHDDWIGQFKEKYGMDELE